MTGQKSAHIIDGKTIAAELRGNVTDAVHRLKRDRGLVPGLAVVLVGKNPASEVYVRNKTKAVAEAGMHPVDLHLPETVERGGTAGADRRPERRPQGQRYFGAIAAAAADRSAEGDRRHRSGQGRRRLPSAQCRPAPVGLPALVPCTPLGCVRLAKTVHASLAGLEAVVIGRSNIVGKPVAQLLLAENATVTICHSKTADLPAVCQRADLVIAAIGRPEFVRGHWIKPGATVIDVGINRIAGDGGKSRIVGDVAYAEAWAVAGAITPVPGGVGPMTIACLLLNTLRATCEQNGLPAPNI